MNRWTWTILGAIAQVRWAWRLVPHQVRWEWTDIALAMNTVSLHVREWQDTARPLPTWVPCQPCGGVPCHHDPDLPDDVRARRLARYVSSYQHGGTDHGG